MILGDLVEIADFVSQVFEAEKMAVGHGAYHKSCFSCRACQRAIDFYNCVSHKVTKLRQAWLQPLTIQLHGFLG